MGGLALGLDDVPNGIVVVQDGGTVLQANAAMLMLLGCERDWLVGRSLSSILTRPAGMLYHASLYPQLRGLGRVTEAYLDFRRQDGVAVPALCSATIRQVEARDVIVISATHMTERRRLEEDLLRTRRITEQIPGVVYQYLLRADGTRCIPYCSEALRDMFGMAPMEVAQDSSGLLDRLHADDKADFGRSVQRSAEQLSPWRHQFRGRRSPEAPWRWLEGTAMPERLLDGGVLWHGFIQDVTERKGVEDAIREKDAADQANRAKNEFLARVSHELRTPLNAILGFAQIIRFDKSHPLPGFQSQRVQHIEEAGRDLLHLIEEVLDITRIESGVVQMQPEWLDVNAMFARVVRLVESDAHQRGIRFDIRAPDAPQVYADPTRLGQVLTNLLSNAVKYNRERGLVTLACVLEADRVVLAVQDAGRGLSEEQVGHLFEPFNRLGAERTSTPGTGLGLVIVKRLVEAMGGSIVVSSLPGEGSTFRIILPRHMTPPSRSVAGPAVRSCQPATTEARERRLLYVEDNAVNALVMQAIFELRPGFDLHVESTGAGAVAWATSHPVDLFLLDMNLPDCDGVSLLQDLRIALGAPCPPAIAVSADALPHLVQEAKLAGFASYLTKPLDIQSAIHVIEATLRSQVTLDAG